MARSEKKAKNVVELESNVTQHLDRDVNDPRVKRAERRAEAKKLRKEEKDVVI